MAIPTKTLASLANRMQDLPVRFYNDPSDVNPFSTIIDATGFALAFGINMSALVGDNGLIQSAHEAANIADSELVSRIVKDPGRVAVGRADFTGAATGAITVTIGAQVYTEADAEDFPNGVWTNGADANTSAVSLAAAINGDTRAGNLYAAVVLTDTVFITARVAGIAGNAAIVVSADEPAAVEDLVGGTDAVAKNTVVIMHTVTDSEGALVEVIIPLPFDATFFSWQVFDTNGGIYATEITARGTVTAASAPVPAYFRLANNGVTDVQVGDIIRLVVQE